MTDCNRRSLFGPACKFKARYDEIPSEISVTEISGNNPDCIRATLYRRIYVHDICTACGKIVSRPTP